ncbi:MAG TPA: GlcNAc-PI de-N-acetylase [Deltaproteobacteria bacterium]|nr:MAG: hypothetical protein A2Z79_05015 [Deltaproteobacteria bacterium GWA2_55_82]OGQ63860.1 MAG: hypothetical protein A3I81_12640 [Deltaproteobacteria bacterium RIFCSPLOWO2_02_FULL_55_12]OIJ72677.1 MAG: hypothetical protein A2V21_312585 [Deltaproteobacteria bacterium GWC2_55_46]HBG47587.1 GlcNAc-PI de-N-acetylase [Deltaproteobacteria bacterium]HCY10498.1 GlcNAc-PI de-N-acetylase [Deltaproteobacteria bacterium]
MRAREFRFIKTSMVGYARELVKDIFGARVLIVAAHPDDEAAGAGALYKYLDKAVFVHVTDGAPRDLVDAASHGFKSAGEYAKARRNELFKALSFAGIGPEDCLEVGIPDQEAGFNLAGLALKLKEMIGMTEPESVMAHTYEGGHPDHDSVSFGVAAAVALLKKEGAEAPPIIEYPLYHAVEGRLRVFEFLPREGVEDITVILTEEEKRFKEKMMDSFTTQAGVLRVFPFEFERFRPAPRYDFAAPPHEGGLYYERFNWGIDGRVWRELASKAIKELGIEGLL